MLTFGDLAAVLLARNMRHERAALQQQALFVSSSLAAWKPIAQRVGSVDRVQRRRCTAAASGAPRHRRRAASQIDCGDIPRSSSSTDLVARVVVRIRDGALEHVASRRPRQVLRLPIRSHPGRQLLLRRQGRSASSSLRAGGCSCRRDAAGRRPASAGPARRAASRCTGASASCWRRRWPCGRCQRKSRAPRRKNSS